jgi:steroid 5-alpha reductase family enzyme
MDIVTLMSLAFFGTLTLQLVAYVYALRSTRVDIIDAVWGLSFIAAIIAMQLHNPSNSVWVVVVDLLVVTWGTRLSWHIYRRFTHSSVQDERYTTLIRQWPDRLMSLQLFFRLFLVQAVLAAIISLPVIVVHTYQPETSWLSVAGLIVWVIGFVFESIADKQLKVFLARPGHDELMTTGLWSYSRHPNYFGEITMWWGIALIACTTPLWWLGIIGSLTISVLICLVSGIPLAEIRTSTKKGWDIYKGNTSVLVPWRPKQ